MERSCSYDTTLVAISADRGTPWFRRTGATPWMLVHRSQCLSPLSLQPPADLVCARLVAGRVRGVRG